MANFEEAKISKITRQDIIDAISIEKIKWSGWFNDVEFLSRIFPLENLPSIDQRYSNASGDIWQHRVNNPEDWDDDWVFHDKRFKIIDAADDLFLQFLCETIHPVVRPSSAAAERICQLYNSYLINDCFQIVEKSRISGKPIYVGRYVGVAAAPGVGAAKELPSGTDLTYVTQQITRMEAAVNNDPGLAIGTAKELIETCCKTILHERGIEFPANLELTALVELTSKELKLTPDDIPDQAKAVEVIRRLLSNLATIAQGVTELRNKYGTGHGKISSAKGLSVRHAKLAVGAASTLVVFLVETHHEKK